ncbi:MAG: hypothetical protein KDK45_10315, partial [Leptospiraceae bacterium]|nr:hypothetical protein [Leptospiraceae bacterium]
MNNVNSDKFLKTSTIGFAYHEILTDTTGKPVDFRFLDANLYFEKLSGLKLSLILGKTASSLFPPYQEELKNWIGILAKVALQGGVETIEQYIPGLDKWLEVQLYSNEKGYCTTLLIDITERKIVEEKLLFQLTLQKHIAGASSELAAV